MLKGAHELFKSLNLQTPRTRMQTLIGMNTVVIEDHYHMIAMDENMNWMKHHIYS